LSHHGLFENMVEEIFLQLMEMHPEEASYMGLHHYDDRLPDSSPEAVEREKGFLKLSLEKLDRVIPDKLDIEYRMDYFALKDFLRLRLFYIEDWPRWKMYPEAIDTLIYSLIPIFMKEYAPLQERFENIVARIEKIPKFLDNSRARLETPIRVFLNLGVESAERLKKFIESIYSYMHKELGKTVASKKDVFDRALDAIERYKEWINTQRPREIRIFHMGEDNLRKYLEIRGIDVEPSDLLERLNLELKAVKEDLRRVVKEINGSMSPHDVIEDMYNKRPANFQVVLAAYEKAIQEAKRVTIEKGIASIPREFIEVRDTPVVIRGVVEPIIYVPPGKFEANKVGKLLITPVTSDEELRLHNAYSIAHLAVREGFPGKHLMNAWNVENKSFVRQLVDAPETVEGWAYYVDHTMSEMGYLNSPRDKFYRLLSLLRIICLAISDIRMSLGDISIQDIVKYLGKQAYMEEDRALSEALLCAHSPGFQLSKYYGYLKFLTLRETIKSILGTHFSLKWFHDTILQSGILPLKYLELLILSKAIDHLIKAKTKKMG